MNNESPTDSFQEAQEAYEALPAWQRFNLDYELEDLILYGWTTEETKELRKERQKQWNREI